ncbi:MAG: peptidoglycan bridge formation glycyltransferase FemA/FemB family protein [bacterium]
MIKEITDEYRWNKFLLTLEPNTFLQSWQWGQLQKQSGEGVRYLGFFAQDKLFGAALLITVNAKRGRHLFCPHGPVFQNEEDTINYLPEFNDYCKKLAKQDKAIALRIAPLLITNQQNTAAFQDLGFRPAPLHVHAECTWNLDISPDEDKLISNMRKTTRHAIRKAQNLSVKIDIMTDSGITERFLPLYHATESRHQFTAFSKDFIHKQVNIFSQGNNIFAVFASHQSQDIAAAILIQFGPTVFYHHGASSKYNNQPPASHLVQWEAIKEARRRGATRYNFWGISPENKPGHPFTGITIFKQGFGGYALDYMHAQDLPLSPLYRKLWLVETLRKLRRGF